MSFTRTLRAVGGAAMAGALLLGLAPAASADQVRDGQWPLRAFKAEEIWQVSTGKGVTVAVIDDGVDPNHPDLKGNILKGKDFINGGAPDPEDGDGHGTEMAGIIAGHGHGPGNSEGVKGLAPNANILPIRDNGSTQEGFLPAIRYAVDSGASVINISMQRTPSPEDLEAIEYAWKHDVLVVTATGNDGAGPADGKIYPANYPGVLAVGGVNRNGSIWEGSNYGPATLLTAPATGIVSTGLSSSTSPYRKADGTSAATAYVSANAALLRAKYPDLSAGQIANRMTKTAGLPASAKGLKLPDEKYGYGFVQPLAALTKDIPPGPKKGPLRTPTLIANDKAGSGPESSAGSESGMSMGRVLLIGLGVVVLLVIVAVVIMLVKRKNNSGGPPPGGWGGSGGAPGYPPQQPGPHQQTGAPGPYPPGPPNPPQGPQQ
ncbi:type VII secretion-associated serine protease mycosin [Streptomyces meridianus]|uniref:Type VII secretion-associated serine protease mycosin n=1 Tax=Streptomyces meridianus TaxID=2938945 RepID=A0ABT0XBL4_9ACTN|nr:type VII secretion-associated serine protease mycosin [Streptomyces meridianus]MCM2579913.1 type VII secretion-associated serine protease mycosin [Streptomyces meridianus]